MKKFMEEFKTFAMKGNVVDMAIGVVIGGAFSKIVSSLVADVITPLIGVLTGGIDLSGWKITLNESTGLVLTYGNFLQSIIDFLLIALSIFVAIKLVSKLHHKEEEKVEAPAPVVDEKVELLKEIRDLLQEEKH